VTAFNIKVKVSVIGMSSKPLKPSRQLFERGPVSFQSPRAMGIALDIKKYAGMILSRINIDPVTTIAGINVATETAISPT